MTSGPAISDPLPPPLRVHRAGEAALLAEYPDTAAVLAAAAALRALAPPHLVDLVPAEHTLLLVGAASQDHEDLAQLLRHLPAVPDEGGDAAEQDIAVVYDGEDLAATAELLGMSTDGLITAHTATTWIAAFGGFAPGFAYLLPEGLGQSARAGADPEAGAESPLGNVPRRAEPRTTVPAGAVGLAATYCGIYPRPSPGGWQLIGRTDAELFDPDRTPPALLTPGTRVRFTAQRPTSRGATSRSAAPAGRGRRRGGPTPASAAAPVLEIRLPGPRALLQDAGRPGRGAIGVSTSGAFDRGALVRANLAVGNPAHATVVEALLGPVLLRAAAPAVVAVSGARSPLTLRRRGHGAADAGTTTADDEPRPVLGAEQDAPIALDTGDELEIGAPAHGLRPVLAVRGGIRGVRRASGDESADEVLGSRSRDTLSGLGPGPLEVGDVLLVGPDHGLDAVPGRLDLLTPPEPAPCVVPVHPGPRDQLLGTAAVDALLTTSWTVRPESDRVGVRLDGPALPVPGDAASLPSEAMVPGAIQVPPSGLPVVFGPDHPTTGGYPVIAVVTRAGLDLLAQAAPGTEVRFVPKR